MRVVYNPAELPWNRAELGSQATTGGHPQKFRDAVQSLRDAPPTTGDVFQDLAQMQRRLINGETITPQQLIVYQIRAGEFNLRVELVSKVAESIMATFRKFQNSQ